MKTYDELQAEIERLGVHAVFGEPGEGWAIEQNPLELTIFLAQMERAHVHSVLEIGTGYRGGLSRFLAQVVGWDVTTVDVQDYGHNYPGVKYIVEPNGKPTFETGQFDLILIDAKPTYDAVRENWAHYRHYASKVMAVHDIAGLRDCQGVTEFWREIAYDGKVLRPEAYEIIDSSERRGGIGYIVLAEFEPMHVFAEAEETVEQEPETKPTKTVKRLPAKKPAVKVAKAKGKAAKR